MRSRYFEFHNTDSPKTASVKEELCFDFQRREWSGKIRVRSRAGKAWRPATRMPESRIAELRKIMPPEWVADLTRTMMLGDS